MQVPYWRLRCRCIGCHWFSHTIPHTFSHSFHRSFFCSSYRSRFGSVADSGTNKAPCRTYYSAEMLARLSEGLRLSTYVQNLDLHGHTRCSTLCHSLRLFLALLHSLSRSPPLTLSLSSTHSIVLLHSLFLALCSNSLCITWCTTQDEALGCT